MSDRAHWDEAHRRRREELEAIKAGLTDRVEDLAPILLPNGHRIGREWREGRRGSKSIILRGAGQGTYRDFEAGTKPVGPIDAIAELVCGGNLREAISWSRSFLGMSDASAEAIEKAARPAEERRRRSEADAAKERERRAGLARQLWHQSVPILGTPADAYLEERGLDLRQLNRVPGVLRYTPLAWCSERGGEFPAMVASLWRSGERQPVAAHRTYLAKTAGSRWQKAAIASPRSTLGSWPGAIIPLQRGEGDRRWRDLEEGELVAFGEGIEEALAIALLQPTWRVAAVGYVANFAQIVLPVWCHVVLCTNNDPDDSEAALAINGGERGGVHRIGAIEALEGKGHVVRVARPPERFKDWNDYAIGRERGDGR